MCPDLVPIEFRDELLLEPVDFPRPAPWSEVRAFLAGELGEIDSVFRSINPVPVSHAIAQVHQAVTATGHNVLVKVLLPPARERARKDLRRARAFSRVTFSEREAMDDLDVQLTRELDLTREQENIHKLAGLSRDSSFVRVPRVYAELSTASVLTVEDLGGIPLIGVLSPARRAGLEMEGFGFDAGTLAVRLMDGAMRQILEQHFYCADVHPQNLLLLPGNAISFASFARCEAVDPEASLVYARFLSSVFTTELPRMSRIFEQLLTATDSSRSEDLRDEFISESHEWLRSVPPANRTRNATDNASPLANWLVAILRTARRNGFEVPAEMLSAFRTLIAVETIAFRLDRAVHMQSAGQEVLSDILLDDVFRHFEPAQQRSALINLLSALRGAPGYIEQIITELAQSRLALNLVTTEHPHSATTRDRRARLLAAAIAAVGVAWLMGEPGMPAVGAIPAARVLAVILGVLYLCMIVLWRRLG